MLAPRPIVPVPASLFTQLRGRRIIVGVPGVGFRADLRGDNPIRQSGRTFVPVLAEIDFYRAEDHGVETFAALVPLDRVWVESTVHDAASQTETTPLDAPISRVPVPVARCVSVLGARIVHTVPDGFVRDVRAVTEPYGDTADRARSIRVCSEADWYRWVYDGQIPQTMVIDANSAWVE
jgi:hypothetical protein